MCSKYTVNLRGTYIVLSTRAKVGQEFHFKVVSNYWTGSLYWINPLTTDDTILALSDFGRMLSVGAIRFEDRFCAKRGGGWVHREVPCTWQLKSLGRQWLDHFSPC